MAVLTCVTWLLDGQAMTMSQRKYLCAFVLYRSANSRLRLLDVTLILQLEHYVMSGHAIRLQKTRYSHATASGGDTWCIVTQNFHHADCNADLSSLFKLSMIS